MKKIIIAGVLSSAFVLTSFMNSSKTIDFTYNGTTEQIKTKQDSVEDFLEENNIKLGKDDIMDKKLDDELEKKDSLNIDEVIKKEIVVPVKDKKEYSIELPYGKKEIKEKGRQGKKIEYRTKHKNKLVKTEEVDKMKERLVTLGSRVEKTEDIDFITKTKESNKKREGTEIVEQEGTKGQKKKIFARVPGKEDELVKEEVIKEPKDKIIVKGTKPEFVEEEVTDLNGDGLIDGLDFIEFHRDEIIAIGRRTGIYPSIIAAQLIHESGRDMNGLAKNANNYFGIKYTPKLSRVYGAGTYDSPTFEFEDGKRVDITATFAHFYDFKTCINAFVDLYWNGLYDNTVKTEIYDLENATVDSMIEAINESPYSTSDEYGKALVDCINVFGFISLDEEAFPDGRKQAGTFDGDEVYKIGEYLDDGLNFEDTTWKRES